MYHRVAVAHQNRQTLSGVKLLDLGCGRGGGISFLQEHFGLSQAYGVDISTYQVNYAQANVKGATFIKGDVENLQSIAQLHETKFDTVISVESWH